MAGPFELALRQFAEKAGDNADKMVRDVVLEVSSRVVIRSPVDTGRFRANWRLSIGTPDSGTTAATDKAGTAAPAAIAGGLPKDAAGKVFYIQNNLAYAWRLEHGWSKQAPAGMVGLTVIEFAGIVDQVAQGGNP